MTVNLKYMIISIVLAIVSATSCSNEPVPAPAITKVQP